MLEEDLKRLRGLFADGQSVALTDAALVPIAAARNPASIKPLLLMLNDDSEDHGMWSLVHAAEQFECMIYIAHFIETLPDLVIASRRWASILMMRVLNSEEYKLELVRQLRNASVSSRSTAASICEDINQTDPIFLAKTVPVIIAARNS